MKNWYVYQHYTTDKRKPFYIGIGCLKARCTSTRNRNKYWHQITASTKFKYAILFDGLSFEDAIKKENQLIALYGRKSKGGLLVNLTSGGQGVHDPSAETRFKIGANRGKTFSDEWRLKLSIARLGKEPANKGKKLTDEIVRAKIKSARAQQTFSLETRLKLSVASTGRRHSNKTKKLLSELRTGKGNGMFGKQRSTQAKERTRSTKLFHKFLLNKYEYTRGNA